MQYSQAFYLHDSGRPTEEVVRRTRHNFGDAIRAGTQITHENGNEKEDEERDELKMFMGKACA